MYIGKNRNFKIEAWKKIEIPPWLWNTSLTEVCYLLSFDIH